MLPAASRLSVKAHQGREREKENEMKRNPFGGAQIKRPLEIWRLMLVFLVIFAGSSVQCAVEREVCRVLGPK
jgi:hypothetical protein